MELPQYFDDFLSGIRPTQADKEDYQTGHKTLTKRLKEDGALGDIIVSTFLQGSIRRATAVRTLNGTKADVDVVVVTKLSKDEYTPQQAMDVFKPFLNKWYAGKWKFNSRSMKIELSYVEMDLVVTSAPSEAEKGILESDSVITDSTLEESLDWFLSSRWVDPTKRIPGRQYPGLLEALKAASWQSEPLYIPDRDVKIWDATHPLAQIQWTWQKNKNTNGHYVNVVKALKWWRKVNYPDVKYPKGYPLEHMIGDNCPDNVQSVAEGITLSLERIVTNYKWYVDFGVVPTLKDRGVPEHNVLQRLSFADFKAFFEAACEAAKIARQALDEKDLVKSVEGWRKLFGNKFPPAPAVKSSDRGGFSPREDNTDIIGGRFG